MNILDKVIGYLNPEAGYNREFARVKTKAVQMQGDILEGVQNSGYSEHGASRKKKTLKSFKGNSKDPSSDVNDNLDLLRRRSRSLIMGAPLATAAVKTVRTNVIGARLIPNPRIDHEFLGLSEDEASTWEKSAKREFNLWASSKHADFLRLSSFYELQGVMFNGWLWNGEGLAIIKHAKPTAFMPYGLKLHVVEADRLSTPHKMKGLMKPVSFHVEPYTTKGMTDGGNTIYSGVEVDKHGGVLAYHISDQYPGVANNKWTRVKAYGERTGQPNVLHVFEQERAEQYRAAPMLAPVITTLKQMSRYTEAELTAAVIQSFFTAFIKTTTDPSANPLAQTVPESEQNDKEDANSYELGAGYINVLGPNEDIVLADPKRPSSGFEPFMDVLTSEVGAAIEVPKEILLKTFNASYSASRAALLEAWKSFKMRRTWFVDKFCQPVYEIWLAEAVATGRVNAPGFFIDPAIRKAWSKCYWVGPAPGQVNPVAEVNAAVKRIENGLSTRENESMEMNGSDVDDNIRQLIKEHNAMKPLNEQGGEIN